MLGFAFWNNGNGTYFSGAYMRDVALDARNGLALDAVIRVPVTRDRWQYLNIGLMRIVDLGRLKQWDHRAGIGCEIELAGPGNGPVYDSDLIEILHVSEGSEDTRVTAVDEPGVIEATARTVGEFDID